MLYLGDCINLNPKIISYLVYLPCLSIDDACMLDIS